MEMLFSVLLLILAVEITFSQIKGNSIWTWGSNGYEELGPITNNKDSSTVDYPERLSYEKFDFSQNFIDMCFTDRNAFVQGEDSTLYVWGDDYDYHYLTDGLSFKKYTSAEGKLITGVNSIDCGFADIFYLTNSNELYAKGRNYYQNLAQSGVVQEFKRIETNVKQFAASKYATIIEDIYGNIKVAGKNTNYHLGDKSKSKYDYNIYFNEIDISKISESVPIKKIYNTDCAVFIVYENEHLYAYGKEECLPEADADVSVPEFFDIEDLASLTTGYKIKQIECGESIFCDRCIMIVENSIGENEAFSWGESKCSEYFLGRTTSTFLARQIKKIFTNGFEPVKVSVASETNLMLGKDQKVYAFGWLLSMKLRSTSSSTIYSPTFIGDSNWESVTHLAKTREESFAFFTNFTCGGKHPSDKTMCGENGQCGGLDQCDCNQGFYGDVCQNVYYCEGIAANVTGVCSSKGDCTSTNFCSCDVGYYGNECQKAYCCYGICMDDDDSSDICNGNGQCIGSDRCDCYGSSRDYDDQCKKTVDYTVFVAIFVPLFSVFVFVVVTVIVLVSTFGGIACCCPERYKGRARYKKKIVAHTTLVQDSVEMPVQSQPNFVPLSGNQNSIPMNTIPMQNQPVMQQQMVYNVQQPMMQSPMMQQPMMQQQPVLQQQMMMQQPQMQQPHMQQPIQMNTNNKGPNMNVNM